MVGFPAGGPLTPLTEEERIKLAEQSSTAALLAVILCLLSGCMCFTVFVAFPLSLWGLSLARTAMDTPDPSPTVAAYAGPARVLNLAAMIHSGLLALFVVSYFMLYIGLFGFAFIAAILGL